MPKQDKTYHKQVAYAVQYTARPTILFSFFGLVLICFKATSQAFISDSA